VPANRAHESGPATRLFYNPDGRRRILSWKRECRLRLLDLRFRVLHPNSVGVVSGEIPHKSGRLAVGSSHHPPSTGAMKDISALKLYTRVARLGSFSAAARECGLSQSQASRIIADLETDLGARLLLRTTRAVVPTEAGAEFLARMESILAALDEAEHSVREGGELRGLLRMSMPTSFGIRTVIPRLSAFAACHPNLHIQLLLEDRRQDLVRDAVDVAIRLGRLVDSTATTKLIATIPRVVVASPDYLQRHGIPATPAELVQHRIVGGTAAAVPTAWMFERDGRRK
jgi:DNA-binding transcriptional LysR family regulator